MDYPNHGDIVEYGDVVNEDHSSNAAGVLLSLVSRTRDGRRDDVSSVVLAEEAKQADGASIAALRIPKPPHRMDSDAWFHMVLARFSEVDRASRITSS